MSKVEEKVDLLKSQIDEIGMEVATSYTLADAMREGTSVSDQAYDWEDAEGNLCALSTAIVAAKARDYL